MKKILLTIFSVTFCFGLLKGAHGFVRYEEQYSKDPIPLKVSGVTNYIPFGWNDYSLRAKEKGYHSVGKPIFKFLETEINAKLDYVTKYSDLDYIMQEIRKNKVDLFIGAYSQTEVFKGLHLLYPAIANNPITVFMIPHRVNEIKSTEDLKKLKGVRVINEPLSDFVNNKINELNPIEASSYDDAFKKLFTREADYIITSYYAGMVEAIKLGLQNQVAPAKQTLWKMPMFVGVGKASRYREKISSRITKYLSDAKNKKAIDDHLQEMIRDIEEMYEGVVPPTYVALQEPSSAKLTTENTDSVSTPKDATVIPGVQAEMTTDQKPETTSETKAEPQAEAISETTSETNSVTPQP